MNTSYLIFQIEKTKTVSANVSNKIWWRMVPLANECQNTSLTQHGRGIYSKCHVVGKQRKNKLMLCDIENYFATSVKHFVTYNVPKIKVFVQLYNQCTVRITTLSLPFYKSFCVIFVEQERPCNKHESTYDQSCN